jgi:ATP-dependent 26S proteasome regulatory subunit
MSDDSGLPAWFDEIAQKFSSGVASVFLLHGDVHGLFADPDDGARYLTLTGFFERVFDTAQVGVFYDVANGLRFLSPQMERAVLPAEADPVAAAKAGLQAKRGRDPETCLPIVERALRTKSNVAVVIASAHFVAPTVSAGIPLPQEERANIQRILNWAQDRELRAKKNIVLLWTDQAAKVSAELRVADGGVAHVLIQKPTQAERVAFLQTTQDREALARMSQGLSLKQLQDALQSKTPLQEKKREILNAEYGDVMEVVEPARGLDDIGGLEHVKTYFKEVLAAVRSGDARLVPMGVTLMGPPGTGKTAIVEALAKEAGFNFVKTKNVRSMWVGESEARMEKLTYGLRSLAPVVVMNDEADLAEGGRDSARGDSGVSERLMKLWMELLSDPKIRGQIIVISCTNRPDRMDAALKRSGRSDERILLPMPSQPERAQILAVQCRRHKIPTSVVDFLSIAQKTDGFSGADLERLVLSAYRIRCATESPLPSQVDLAAFDAAVQDFIAGASQAEIDRMTIVGLAECSSRRLLPPNVQEIVDAIALRGHVEGLDEILARLTAKNIISVANVRATEGN